MVIINVANPAAPVGVGYFVVPEWVVEVMVDNNYLYVAHSDGLAILRHNKN